MKEDEVKEPQVEIREPETEETMSPTGNKLRETKLTQNKGLESDRIGIIVLVILIGMFGIKMLNDLGESLRTPKRRPTTVSTGRTTYPEPIDEIESNDDWMETHSNNYTAPIDPREAQTMQNWQGCARLPTPSGTMATEGPWLRDERDGHIYQIRKFADGQCWMVNNLAYGGDTAQGEPDGCRKLDFNGETTGTPTNVFGAGTYGDCRLPYLDVDTPDDAKFGYLYNWQAAVQTKVAFNGNYYQPPQPTQGICPEGWHLPTGGEDGDLTKLYRLWNNDAQAFYRADLWQPAHAGYSLDDGTYYGAGTTDKYWTSTQKGSSLAYLWNLREHDIDTADDFYKDYGYSVRCIADASSSRATLVEPEATTVPVVAKTHMVRPDCPGGQLYSEVAESCVTPEYYGCGQPMDTLQHWDGCAEMVISDGPVKVAGVCLMDERDGKTYEVRRLNDGQCWQVDNLAYGGDKVTGAADVCLENEGTFTGAVSEYADGSGKGYTRTDIFGPGTYGNCGIWTMDTAIVDRYGYYYDWAAAMQDPEAYDKNYAYQQKAEPRQGICPEGWHLPQENDFSDVINKSAATGKNFNIDQFKIAYAGVYDSSLDGKYYTQGNAANYWTSTYWHQVGAGYDNTLGRAYGWSRFINSYVGNSVAGLSDGLTVRCVKN